MGRARISGSNVILLIKAGDTDVAVGEIDKFTAKKLEELKKAQALGAKTETSWVKWKGWEFSFEGGKVDWQLAKVLHSQDVEIVAGRRSPYFKIQKTIEYLNGDTEVWVWDEVTLYGYEIDVPMEDVTEKISGFTGKNREVITSSITEVHSLQNIKVAVAPIIDVINKMKTDNQL